MSREEAQLAEEAWLQTMREKAQATSGSRPSPQTRTTASSSTGSAATRKVKKKQLDKNRVLLRRRNDGDTRRDLMGSFDDAAEHQALSHDDDDPELMSDKAHMRTAAEEPKQKESPTSATSGRRWTASSM